MSLEVVGFAIVLASIMISLVLSFSTRSDNSLYIVIFFASVVASLYLIYALPSICPLLFCDPCGFYAKFTLLVILFTLYIFQSLGGLTAFARNINKITK